ncbi:MAG: hypothetical protein COA41_11155 [Sphingopyxis sp.]|nr:MAG: hypothetical protein COA41_11155 [Sphingopyxis sp.]
MKERPILFKGAMVRTILEGRKTVTRRALKLPHGYWESSPSGELIPVPVNCPYGQPGDRLWVRESWTTRQGLDGVAPRNISHDQSVGYLADTEEGPWLGKVRPSIHMPRWASRILLEVTDVRIERLQDISEEQAEAEGCYTNDQYGDLAGSCDDLWPCPACSGNQVHQAGSMGGATEVDCNECRTAALRFRHLWVSINGIDSWDANPWVWVVEFKRIEP